MTTWERIEHLLSGKASDREHTGRNNRLFAGGDLVGGSHESPVA